MTNLYVVLDEEGKITTVFSSPQNPDDHPGVIEITTSDPRYWDYYNDLSFWDKMWMPAPTND